MQLQKMKQIFILFILAPVLPGITVGVRPSGVPRLQNPQRSQTNDQLLL